MSESPVSHLTPLGFTWKMYDPFLFCAHHLDNFPAGNERLGPAASLAGRQIGQDFTLKDGWRMYHGDVVPGFPAHPHRGFETVTVVLDGFVDHSDGSGAAGRYGNGDVQWMTAGSGMQHAEMFPLLKQDGPNRTELFQIWLNLPRAKKMVPPHYKMLWAEDMTRTQHTDKQGKTTRITLIAGTLDTLKALEPAPDSWAADPENEVAIWIIALEAGAKWQVPAAKSTVGRTLYFFEGKGLRAVGQEIPGYHSFKAEPGVELELEAASGEVRLLLLQGKPIAEPVVQYGPFVMNTEQEIYQTYAEYQSTQFGGWAWDRDDPVHPRTQGRFARYADGSEETRG